jgi:hypothetical protein
MHKLYVLLTLTLLASCQKAKEAPTGLAGEWHLETYDFSSYSATGTLLSHQVSPGGEGNRQNIIITDSTIAYFSDMSIGPGPDLTPGEWVARKYTRQGDTLRYVDNGQRNIIVTLTSTALTLHTSSKQTTPSYYQESDSYYTRVR